MNVNRYSLHDRAWLLKKLLKSGENRKLSPRRTGPWTIVKLYPNGGNFRIENGAGDSLVVHHNRLTPYKPRLQITSPSPLTPDTSMEGSALKEDDTDAEVAEESGTEESSEVSEESDTEESTEAPRRYPLRRRRQRVIPDAIPWDTLPFA